MFASNISKYHMFVEFFFFTEDMLEMSDENSHESIWQNLFRYSNELSTSTNPYQEQVF